uniref:histidine kinase n=1 Tax=Chromera velia CCMP2878 TaxID=1169474 RepID=A0A0G4FU05_9ALVE|eukprot:Cvel_18756.t1-p1 / transcript=Cvel_18756.t1 / gene=Cvel_18756 / organism=Chromera_velia_CCMP2878 / gene_product=hypothetical protein / transcript_product=hypothetical protein / location=Cvel_scaffold1573:16880-21043(-) / protein_length=810 / sequence_SO=supercontig / SO=protein_coding / is_pseudo=false
MGDKQIETRSVVTMLMTMLCGGVMMYTTRDAPEGLLLFRHGIFSLWNKLLLIPMHYSPFHFWVLNVIDGLQFIACSPSGLPLSLKLIFPIVAATLAGAQRHLVERTLTAVFTEVQRRQKAEMQKTRFLSYVMHELRNPLSGAALLLVEFRGILSDLAAAALGNAGSLHVCVQKETARLLILTGVLRGQFDKMRGVCDDVLQLEKLDKGGFSFAFASQDVQLWAEDVVEKQRVLVHGQGHTTGRGVEMKSRWEVADPEVEALLRARPFGVADFSRLEQVIDNFVGNARKFTKEGEISVETQIRAPTPLEHQQLDHILSATLQADKEEVDFTETRERGERVESSPGMGTKETEDMMATQRQWRVAMRELSEMEAEAEGMEGGQTTNEASSEQKEQSLTVRSKGLRWVVLRVTVKDTGPGLSAEDKSKLFLPYSQIRAGELQNGGGTGLGLCICSSFVKAHGGGQIGAESEGRGLGSEFYFQILLPLVRSESQPLECPKVPPRTPSVTSRLLRTDTTPARRIRAMDYEPLHEEWESGKGQDQTAEEKEGGPGPSVPKSSARPSFKCGNQKDGQREIQPAFACSGSPSSSPSAYTYTADVLVVDDDHFCLMASEAAVRRMGYSVETAPDGKDAVEMIVKHEKRYRLILMDNNMGDMDGPSATKAIVAHFRQTETEKPKTPAATKNSSGTPGQEGQSDLVGNLRGEGKEAVSWASTKTSRRTLPSIEGPGASRKSHPGTEGQEEASKEKQKEKEEPSGGDGNSVLKIQQPPLILGCTADTSDEVERRFVEAGAAGMMHKPVRIQRMSNWLARVRN